MARAYPGFHSMKQLRVLLLPPGWDASPSQGYPQQYMYLASTHLYTWVERDNVGQSILSKETTRWQGLGVEPPTFRSEVQRTNHYTTAPPLSLLYMYIHSPTHCRPTFSANLLKIKMFHINCCSNSNLL